MSPVLSEKEEALNSAVASVEMEGYKLSTEDKRLCMDMLDGKLSKTAFIKALLERYGA